MKKIALGLLCCISMTQAIEIDVPFVQSQADSNKQDVNSRLLLLKYYMQKHAYDKAKLYVQEILAVDASHVKAKAIEKRLGWIFTLQKQSKLSHATSEEMMHHVYKTHQHKVFVNLYEGLKSTGMTLSESVDLDAAFSFYALGDIPKSQELLAKHHYKNHKRVAILKQKLAVLQATKVIEKRGDEQAVEDYVYVLKQSNNPKQVMKKLKHFVKTHPNNAQAKITLAQQFYWQGKLDEAFHTLYPVRKTNALSTKLYTNILYDKKDYKHALYFLPSVISHEKSRKERFILEKKMAYTYLYVGKEAKAEALFKKLIQENPQDKELRSYHDNHVKNTLLKDAIRFHKAKKIEKALSNYIRYYQLSHDIKIAKEIAELYYFHKQEQKSIRYFEAYLRENPRDTLILYHLASAYEKAKNYSKSIPLFQNILHDPQAKEYDLAMYHYGDNLMRTFKDDDWVEARRVLESLVRKLDSVADPKDKALRKFANDALTIVKGPVRKPTRYKDIILTEGSYKIVKPSDVFAQEKVSFIKSPTAKELLGVKERHNMALWAGVDYVEDSVISHTNYKIGVKNLFHRGDIRYGLALENFTFSGQNNDSDGVGVFIDMGTNRWNVALGVDHFDDFDMIVPKISWSPHVGAHSMYMDVFYRNGAFVNYRNCMLQNEINVLHFGLYDSVLMDNLKQLELGMDINHFDDGNDNVYGQFTYPLFQGAWLGLEHHVDFNENIEYNSKPEVCSHPMEFYDTSYLKYRPKVEFKNGFLQASIGTGYSFNNEEMVMSYGLRGDYTIDKFATFELQCERQKSAFTSDDMTYCRFNVIQAW